MNKNNVIRLFCILTIYFLPFGCFGQKLYTFKKWKSSYLSEQNNIVFQLDTTDSKNDKATFLVCKIIRDNLDANGIKVNAILFPTDSILDSNKLCLRFTPLSMAYVVTNAFQADIPLCKRIRITQIEPKVNPKKSISTDISIAIDKFEDNIEAFGVDFSKKLLKHFNVPMPYKEFRFEKETYELDE